MSYKLPKPYTKMQRAAFVAKYSYDMGLKIEETENELFAINQNETIIDGQVQLNLNYEIEKAEKDKQVRIEELKEQLEELDKKRIRAICEPSMKTETQSWLEYYNEQVEHIRQVMAEL